MATLSDAAALGYVLPTNDDLISGGDNAISENARVTTELLTAWRFQRGTMPAGTDVDNLFTIGNHYTGNPANVETLQGTLAVEVPSTFAVIGAGTIFSTTQLQIPTANSDAGFYYRTRRTSTAWTEWVDLSNAGTIATAPPTSDSHDLREAAFREAYPLVSTGGKGTVVLRFDHGLTTFKATLWPLLQQYGVRAYIAMNSRLWGEDENSGATQADARAWIASGLVEFGNHTADHADKNTGDGIFDTIVHGRLELEEQLQTTIHGFTVPGLTGFNQLEGFGSGTLDSFSSTYAGGLILANHGITSGGIGQPIAGGSRRVLDGQVRQGGRHYTFEAATWAEIKQQIDAAASTKTALTLMAHPRTMGASGYWTPALAEQVIAYIRQLIDAGTLADLSYYQSHHATTAALPGTGPYDSGLRNIDALVATDQGWTAGTAARLERTGTAVDLTVQNLARESAGTGYSTVLTLPAGFRPAVEKYGRTFRGYSFTVQTSGVVRVNGPGTAVDYLSITFTDRTTPPTTPPGSPA